MKSAHVLAAVWLPGEPGGDGKPAGNVLPHPHKLGWWED